MIRYHSHNRTSLMNSPSRLVPDVYLYLGTLRERKGLYSLLVSPPQDQSLMVQARKVQYQCMSKLSPRELATRGHQFFAQGERTAGNPHGNLAENGKQVTCTLSGVV